MLQHTWRGTPHAPAFGSASRAERDIDQATPLPGQLCVTESRDSKDLEGSATFMRRHGSEQPLVISAGRPARNQSGLTALRPTAGLVMRLIYRMAMPVASASLGTRS